MGLKLKGAPLSISWRIILGLSAQMLVFGLSAAYLAYSVDALFEYLSVAKDELEPVAEDLKALTFDLKEHEGLAQTSGLERFSEGLSRLRIFDRLRSDLEVLRRISQWERLSDEARGSINLAAAALEDLAFGDRLVSAMAKGRSLSDLPKGSRDNKAIFSLALERLRNAVAYNRNEEATSLARDILVSVRYIRTSIQSISGFVLSATRELNLAFFELRQRILYVLIAIPAFALFLALLVMVLSVKALSPLGRLAVAVGKIGRGEPSSLDPSRFAGDMRVLAEALVSLEETLRRREADLHAQKDALAKAERLALVGRMASVVAHEIRNPLNSIALNLDLLNDLLLQGGASNGQKVRELVEAIGREVERLADITEEYLKFGRLPKGVLAPCDLLMVVGETCDFMAKDFEEKGIELTKALPDGPLMVKADESQLRQAFINILRNALEAVPEGGKVRVEVSDVGGKATVSVHDNGPGIPEEVRSRLFEPFVTTKPRGTGLGLAFVQQVMNECGGEVTIESKPGLGTTVRLTLRRVV